MTVVNLISEISENFLFGKAEFSMMSHLVEIYFWIFLIFEICNLDYYSSVDLDYYFD